MGVVEFGQLGVARLPDIAGAGIGQGDDIGDALFVAVAIEAVDHRRWCGDPRGHRAAADRCAESRGATRSTYCGSVIWFAASSALNAPRSNTPSGPWNIGSCVIASRITSSETSSCRRADFLVEQAVVDQLAEHLVDDAHLLGLAQIDWRCRAACSAARAPAAAPSAARWRRCSGRRPWRPSCRSGGCEKCRRCPRSRRSGSTGRTAL